MGDKLGLQGRLAMLVVAAILPLALLSAWAGWRAMGAATEQAQAQLQLSASLVAANHDRVVEATRNLLSAISLMPDLRTGDRQRCIMYFEGLRGQFPIYANLGLLDPQGATVCHASTLQGDATAADRPYFQQAVRQKGFAMGQSSMGRITRRRVIQFALAIVEKDTVVGVVFAALDLAEAGKDMEGLRLPGGVRVSLIDRGGFFLLEHPPRPELPPERRIVNPGLLEAARELRTRLGESVDTQGQARIYAAVPGRAVGTQGYLAVASIDRARIRQASLARLWSDLGILGLTLLAGLAVAWWIGRRSIVAPAREILRVVGRLKRGELDARVPLQERWRGSEFTRIAAAFNLLADSLALNQRELQAELERGRGAYEILEQVLNSMPDGLIAISASGEVLMQNAAAAAIIPLDSAPPEAGQWPRTFGLYHADGKTLYASEDLPLVRAARGESGQGEEMLVRNRLVPGGRLLDITFRPVLRDGELTGGLVVFADITQRRKDESDLLLLRKAVARLNDIVMITEAGPLVSPGPRIVFVNEAFERHTGYSARDAVDRTPEMLYGPRTDRAVVERIRKSLMQGAAVREELTHYAKDGREMLVELDIVALVGDSGTPTHLISVQRDITARKATERALLDSGQELEMFTRVLQRTAEAAKLITGQQSVRSTLQEVASQARLVIGSHAAQVSVTTESDWEQAVAALSLSARNASFARARSLPPAADVYALAAGKGLPLRLTQAQLQAHPLLRGFAGLRDGHPPVRGLLALILTDRSGEEIGVLQVLDKEKGEFTERDEYVLQEIAHLAATAIENARLFQQIRGFNASLESRIAERTTELSRQEARFRALAEQAPAIVWNVDVSGRVNYLNRAWMDLVGGTMEDWLGHKWMQRTHPEDLEEMKLRWTRSRQTQQPYTGTRRILGKDGSWHTTSYRAAPVTDERGGIAFWVGVDSDITELKAIEQALRNSNEELQAFSYSVSHDLRAPLGAIGGFARALEHRVEATADERALHFLARIHAGVAKMEQLIDAMLSLAKVARAPLVFEPVDLSELARDAVEGLREHSPERQVAVQVQDGLSVHGDARLLRVVVENLVGNAWKFTSQRAQGEIEVGTKGEGVFYVRDNGAGFDMAYADKLFGAFQRLHTDAEFPGTGIGLATVRRVIARHQGRVWCQSVAGEGTTFFFSLSALAPPAWLAGSGS
ncbi:MAG: PAS domain S-box protein [Haliea sp.]|nr:MAG: PAS domain S-box protein [Haliea sp.]